MADLRRPPCLFGRHYVHPGPILATGPHADNRHINWNDTPDEPRAYPSRHHGVCGTSPQGSLHIYCLGVARRLF